MSESRTQPIRLALIGSGPSALYILKHVLDRWQTLSQPISSITAFERGDNVGVGMPYSSTTTDRLNICNISSEEIPPLVLSLVDWLQTLDQDALAILGVDCDNIDEKATYPRIALGAYFQAQWRAIAQKLCDVGIAVKERTNCPVEDIIDNPTDQTVTVVTGLADQLHFDRVVIATGHQWPDSDRPDDGYFSSPWPIHKLLPKQNEMFPFPIGLLGASLSAFDVITSLAHRHGRFKDHGADSIFVPHSGSGDFRLVMHSSHGWLPHLQYEQKEPFRDIYRHVTREELMELTDNQGFLRLDDYFDRVCRPVLIDAFRSDRRLDIVRLLQDPTSDLGQFTDTMMAEHKYDDPFDGMRREFPRAERSVNKDKPIFWKEALDDLIYTLNYHAERMPAEDHLRFHRIVVPLLMNVIAALPHESARILFALRDAGRLELIKGHTEMTECENGRITVQVSSDGHLTTCRYQMFIDCTGQDGISIADYPFQSLVRQGAGRAARVEFASLNALSNLPQKQQERLMHTEDGICLQQHGVDINAAFQLRGSMGEPNPRIHDIAFPHTSGLRPYSYGLQACNHTAGIVVGSWISTLQHANSADRPEGASDVSGPTRDNPAAGHVTEFV